MNDATQMMDYNSESGLLKILSTEGGFKEIVRQRKSLFAGGCRLEAFVIHHNGAWYFCNNETWGTSNTAYFGGEIYRIIGAIPEYGVRDVMPLDEFKEVVLSALGDSPPTETTKSKWHFRQETGLDLQLAALSV